MIDIVAHKALTVVSIGAVGLLSVVESIPLPEDLSRWPERLILGAVAIAAVYYMHKTAVYAIDKVTEVYERRASTEDTKG